MDTLTDAACLVNGVVCSRRPDVAAVKAALRGREFDLLRHLGVDWPQRGRGHIHCPFPGHDDRNPSWRWDAQDARYYCTCAPQGGDVLDVAQRMLGCALPEALAHIAGAFLGERPDLSSMEKIRSASDASSLTDRAARNREKALTQWRASRAIEGPAAVYLTEVRGLTRPPGGWPASLRSMNALEHWRDGAQSHHPAIVAALARAPEGLVEAIGRIWLAGEGRGKASLAPNKAALGPIKCLACWMGTPSARLIVAEGLEDALSILAAGAAFVCAAFTGDNVANLTPPPGVGEIVVFGDRAKDGEGLDAVGARAVAKARPRWEAAGVAVRVVVAGAPYKDANDVLRAEGARAVRGIIG
jgi:hypothetical protein